MAAQHVSYTNLTQTTDISRKKRDWESMPKLEDLPKDHRLVQSFSAGRLHRSPPLIFTQAARRSFDGQFLGAALLGELLPSDLVYWLELPQEPFKTAMLRHKFKGELKSFRKLGAAQEFYFRAFHQLPNAFYIASGRDASQHDEWLKDSSPCARHQQRNAGAGNLPSGVMGLPIRILYDPIARKTWVIDGESDPSTGCQHIVMLGQTVYAGSLEHIWKLPRRHLITTSSHFTAKGCNKSYFAFDSGALAKEIQANTPEELAATLRALDSTKNGEALVTWGDLREIIARLRRLYNILSRFGARTTRRADWRCPDDLQAIAKEAEGLTEQLKSGPLKLGREVSQNGQRSEKVNEDPISEPTPDGAKTEALIEQVLSTRRKSGGQGRKRKLSDPEDHGDSDEQWWKAPEKRLRPNINNSEKNREMEDPEAE